MSQPAETSQPAEARPAAEPRPLPVLVEPRALPARVEPVPLPAVATAGTVGFLAGLASLMLVRLLRRPGRVRAVKLAGGRRSKGLQVASSHSFLVDVHLLKDR